MIINLAIEINIADKQTTKTDFTSEYWIDNKFVVNLAITLAAIKFEIDFKSILWKV